jgi:predicted dinucleotide-binding enzyme
MNKIGILGSGNVGQALGKGFADKGYEVKIGSRTPNSDKLKSWVEKTGKKASTGSLAQAAAFGNIIVLATPGEDSSSTQPTRLTTRRECHRACS